MSQVPQAIIVTTAISAGGVGGIFVAFSAFVMRALAKLPASQGISTMQAINVAAVRPPFMIALFGTAAFFIYLVFRTITNLNESRSLLLFIGAVLYLVGVIGLTAVYHVPKNDALAKLDPASVIAVQEWNEYTSSWARLNRIRTLAGLGASTLFVVALTRID